MFVKIREIQINTGIEVIVGDVVYNHLRGIRFIDEDVVGIIKFSKKCESAGNGVGNIIYVSFFLYHV